MTQIDLLEIHQNINRQISLYFGSFLRDSLKQGQYWPLEITMKAIGQFENMIKECRRKHYLINDVIKFNPLNSDHMAMLLYLVSRELNIFMKNEKVADAVSYLNKILHSIDVWHTTKLPEQFFFVHPVGTVLGRAKYGTFLVVYQGVTVGSSKDIYPTFLGSTIMYSNSSVLGNCIIGDNTIIAANTMVINENIKSNTKVINRTSTANLDHQSNTRKDFLKGI